MARVAVLDYGMGNLRSVARAVERVGGEAVVTSDPVEAGGADAMVVPGVGAFGACVANLRAAGLDVAVVEFARSERPLLGVCLGMQVLFERSEEGGGEGLGLFAGEVRRLGPGVKVPHMGWNETTWIRDHPFVAGLPSGTRFYFVHSYACIPEQEVTVGRTEHGTSFAAAVGKGSVFATQFHPEKSGDAGMEVYRNFVKASS